MCTVRYDERVLQDLKGIDPSIKKKIKSAIESKLAAQPELFGKPLRQSLAGFRVLRVGNYRVVFILKTNEVLVLLIGDRNYVYKETQKRFG